MPDIFLKDPDAALSYGVDLKPYTHGEGETDWLEAGDDVVASNVVVAVTQGTVALAGSASVDDGKISQKVAGGAAGETAKLRFRWTTNNGLVDDRTITLLIEER